ncbi:MAG: insulinase family protein [Alphaproteobacteria bacterium]|nr:insulinase family protein [Alphaproteobacteria bacterium]
MLSFFCVLALGALTLSAAPLPAPAQAQSAAQTAEQSTQTPETGAEENSKESGEKVFNAQTTKLANGLQIVVVSNHRAPVVTHMVWYKVGAADEIPGKSGIAHFMEHLMFKGSEVIGGDDLKPGEFSEIIRALGGQDNAFTAQDYTAYFQSISKDHLERVMRMEAGRMRHMTLPPDEVLSERQVILEERRQRTDNDPRGRFAEQMEAAAFPNNPYGTPVIGWLHEMEQLTREDAATFHKRWYAPNNAILVVSGDVEAQDVFTLADKIYGSIPARDVPERHRPRSPVFNSLTSVTLEDPSIREPVVQTLYRAPSLRQDPETSYALEVLAEIMGGGPTSRLYRMLVIEKKIATGAGMTYKNPAWDDSEIWISATPTPGQTLGVLETAIKEELRKVVEHGITQIELDDAKTRMQDEAIYARDSLTGPAMVIGSYLASGASLDDVEHWPDRIRQVTIKQVREAAKRYLNPDEPGPHPPVTGYLLPKIDQMQEDGK